MDDQNDASSISQTPGRPAIINPRLSAKPEISTQHSPGKSSTQGSPTRSLNNRSPKQMSKVAPPVIYRAIVPPQIAANAERDSPTLRTFKHTPTLSIDNKIALFESHAQVSKDRRVNTIKPIALPRSNRDKKFSVGAIDRKR